MNYYLNLFSPQTFEAFNRSEKQITGFRNRYRKASSQVKPGDRFICYMTKLSRWIGILEVIDGPFDDNTPIFFDENDPFSIRFRIKPIVWLDKEKTIPIKDDRIWESLSFTKGHDKGSSTWTGKLRGGIPKLDPDDAKLLEDFLLEQSRKLKNYPLDEREYEKLITHRIRRIDKTVTVSVPQDVDDLEEQIEQPSEIRESLQIQGFLGQIGLKMGLKIWIPKQDREPILSEWDGQDFPIIDILPLNYDETTLKTIEQIDVLWLRGRSIVRAFEVEHTTSVYSGILRMADLLALQPNMDIKLHIVAPITRKEKVFRELLRPVFSLLDKGPLSETCTFLDYESVREIAELKHLAYLSDNFIEEYAEEAE